MMNNILIAIWASSLVLIGLAVALFGWILLRRWLGAHGLRRSMRLAIELSETLIEQAHAKAMPSARLSSLTRNPRRTALAIIELSAILRGRDFERAMAALREAGAPGRMSRLLKRPGLDTRLMAIDALGLTGGATARRVLHRALNTCPISETVAAAHALHSMGEMLDLGLLLDRVHGNRRGAPAELANLLLEIARQNPVRLEIALDGGRLHPSLQIQLIKALGRARAIAMVGTVQRSAGASNPAVRAAAIKALGVLGGPSQAATLRQAAQSDEPEMQARAAEAIGQLGLISLSPVLAGMIESAHADVRLQAGWALARLGETGLGRLKQIAAGEGRRAGPHIAQMILAERQAAQ